MGTQESNDEIETLTLDDNAADDAGDGGSGAAAEDRGDNFKPTDGADEGAEGEGGEGADQKRGGIPPERFNEINDKRKAAEEEAARLRAENEALKAAAAAKPAAEPAAATPAASETTPAADPAPAASATIKELNKQAADALLEGDVERYSEIQQKIMDEVDRQATIRVMATLSQQQAQQEINSVVAKMESEFPVLAAKGGDPAAISACVARRDSYVASGMTVAAALERAAKEIGSIFSGAPAKPSGEQPADGRPAAAAARAATVAAGQPPSIEAGVGDRATAGRINVAALSEKEFNALPEAEKKRLRGD